MAITKQASGELKSRVNGCIDKLSDRATLTMAANELEAIARTLPIDSFAPFLNCLSATDESEKSPVRRQCVRLISVLSAAHGDALSPHVPRMISAVLRRLRDPESAVQSACVDAVASIAAHVNSPPFSIILKPLVDTLFFEQDVKPQIGAALCLSAAVEAAPEPDLAELRKLLGRVVKLIRSDAYKGKAALISLVGSIVSSDCVRSKSLLSSIVSTAVDYLSSEDWAARKEAAEVLEKVAVACTSLSAEFKSSCVAALESRRFDKVKLVREKMNRALELWKDLPEQSKALSPPNVESPHVARKTHPSRSPVSSSSSSATSSSSSSRKSSAGNPASGKLNLRRNSQARNTMMDEEDALRESFQSHNMSLIRQQLEQIETQQSNLLDLLQRFMGSSKKGIRSLEERVDGLEKVVDVMFAISTSKLDTCWAELLSPKFWRKAEGLTVSRRRQGMANKDQLGEI